MAGSIKGIVVEIGGDTSGLQNALKKVNSATSSLSKELKGINSLLKLDPKNTELLSQKQAVLKENIKQTSEKLQELKKTQDLYIKSGGDLNSSQYRNLQREIILTENNLKQLKLEASNWTKASTSLSEISSKMKSLGDAVSNVGKKASVVSGLVGSLFGIGIKYNAEIEKSTKAFETFLGSTEEASNAIENIRTQSENSPFNTDELIKANQMLITTGESADNSKNTISALADAIALTGGGNEELSRMASNLQQIKNAGKATSMDIRQFAYAGIDVYGILAETTGKNVEELKKMDITYEDLSNALIKASSEGGKYYDGQAKMTSTLTGKISTLKKTFNDLLGELSKSLMPIIGKITEGLQQLVKWFKNLNQNQKNLITKIGLAITALGPALIIIGKLISFGGTIAGGLSNITGLIAKVSASSGGLSGVLTALSGPIGIVITAVALLTAGFIALWNKSENFRESMIEIGQSLIKTYNEHIKPTLDNIKEIILILWNDVLQPLLKYLWEKFSPIIEKAFVLIGQVVANVFDKIGKIIKIATDILKGLITFLVGVFTGDWNKAWEKIKTIVDNIWNIIKTITSNVINSIKDTIINVINTIMTNISNVFNNIKNTVSNIWTNIKNNIDTAVSSIRDGIINNFQTAYNRITSIFKNIGSFFGNIWDNVKNTFSSLGTKIGDAMSGAVKSGINGVLSKIENTVNKFINMINSAIGIINEIPGVSISRLNRVNIPKLAKGGIVDSATLAMIGEGNSAEAVIPLDKTLTKYIAEAMRQVGGNRSINVNFYPQQMTEAELDRALDYIDRRYGLIY